MKNSFEVAKANAGSLSQKNRQYYDHKARAARLEVGDRVLVKKLHIIGKQKWEEGVHVVKKCVTDLPVYDVTNENGKGKDRTLHRNLLLPCGSLDAAVAPAPEDASVVRSKPRSQTSHADDDMVDDEGDEASEIVLNEVPPVIVTLPKNTQLSAEAPEFVATPQRSQAVDTYTDTCLKTPVVVSTPPEADVADLG